MRALSVTALSIVLIFAASPTTASTPDVFYVQLLESGTRDYLRGEYEPAARKLRVACFGLLDEPPLLAEGFVRLALAQAGAEDERGFRETIERLLEVESAFGSYGRLAGGTSFKSELERVLPEMMSTDDLAAIPAFAPIASRMREEKLAAVPPRRLRRQLEQRLASDPFDPEALVLLTRLDIAQDQEPKAARRIDALLATRPDHRMARCLRGQMRLRRDECVTAMEDLSWCTRPPTDEVLGARYLRCLVQAADWQAAGGYLASLPLDLRSRQEIVDLVLAIPPDRLEDLSRAPETVKAEAEERAPAPSSTHGSELAHAQGSVSLLNGDPIEPPRRESATVDANVVEATRAVETSPPEDSIADLREDLARARTREEHTDILARVAAQAARGDREPQYLAAEIAYRLGDHALSTEYFRAAGRPPADRPLLLFYYAVALFETGDVDEAAEAMHLASPRLAPTPFVEDYRRKILELDRSE